MTITLWIHRLQGSGILVEFKDKQEKDAYDLGVWRLMCDTNYLINHTYSGPIKYDDNNHISIGQSDNYHISLHYTANRFHPKMFKGFNMPHHLDYSNNEWSPDGYVLVSKDEVYTLPCGVEPEGFIPGESQRVWKKERRTHAELDAELDEYFHWNEIMERDEQIEIIRETMRYD